MEKVNLSSEIEILEFGELDQIEKILIQRAKETSKLAYAPYSCFRVGSAILLQTGEILQSSNQENASFPVGVCAERLVLGYAGANFPDSAPMMLAVVAQRADEDTWAGVSPCGVCRQTINEAEVRFGVEITMLFLRPDERVYRAKGISSLLPLKFDDLIS